MLRTTVLNQVAARPLLQISEILKKLYIASYAYLMAQLCVSRWPVIIGKKTTHMCNFVQSQRSLHPKSNDLRGIYWLGIDVHVNGRAPVAIVTTPTAGMYE